MKKSKATAACPPVESSSLILLGELVESQAFPAFEDTVWRLNGLADAICHHPNYAPLVTAIRQLVEVRDVLNEFVEQAHRVSAYGVSNENS